MNREDVIRLAHEANRFASYQTGDSFAWQEIRDDRFATLVAAAERETLAAWMGAHGFATGHGDTIGDMLNELTWQIDERVAKAIETEHEECVKVCIETGATKGNSDDAFDMADHCAAAIRARGEK